MCMESPPPRTPSLVFFVSARLHPYGGAKVVCVGLLASQQSYKSLIFNKLLLSLLHKVKPFGFTPIYV